MDVLPRGPSGSNSDRKYQVIIALLGLALLGSAGAMLFMRAGGDSTSTRRQTWLPDSGGDDTGPKASAQPTNRLLAAGLTEEEDEDLGFGDLLDVLGVETSNAELKPLADQFAKEFMAEPALKKAYRDFADDEKAGIKRSASQFLAHLEELPEFKRIAARWGSSPATSNALMSLFKSPRLGKFWKRQEKKPTENALVTRIKQLAASKGASYHDPARDSRRQAALGQGTFGAKTGASSAGGSSTSAQAVEGGGLAVTQGGEGIGQGGGGAPQGGGPGASSGADAHRVEGALGPIASATQDPMAIFCSPEKFGWLCDFLTPAQRMTMFGAIDADGLWGACWKLQLFDRCTSACSASSGKCSQKAGWSSCLEAHNNAELACVQECRQPPYAQWCTIPDDVRGRLCVAAWPANPPSECGSLGQQTGTPTTTTTGGGTTGGGGGGDCDNPDCKPPCPEGSCEDWPTNYCANVDEWRTCQADNGSWRRLDSGDCACQGGSCSSNCN